VKLAPVAAALDAEGIEHTIIHTGQHYDEQMSAVFFEDLIIPAPDYNLAVGSGFHGAQTAQMMLGLEPVLNALQPDWVLTYGDTNSTLAAAIVSVKLHLPLAHLEAGLRSFNRKMPEEHNRVLTDHASNLLLAPTELAMRNLAAEGLDKQSELVGDVMADVCLRVADATAEVVPEGTPDVQGPFALATIHRAENTDDPARLSAIITALQACPIPVVLAAHPRLRARAEAIDVELDVGSVRTVDPLGYPQMIAAAQRAVAVITDSGGLQKEAYLLQTPCTTLRTETEWVETLVDGWNLLDPDLTQQAQWLRTPANAIIANLYGDGHAARQVAAQLLERAPKGY